METTVLDLPAPVAQRLRRPGWRDPRLLAGIAMVAGSVALGSWIVQAAQGTTDVYVARSALTPGAAVEPGDLRVVQVRLAPSELDGYLAATGGVPDGLVALRVVGAGEMVPRAAVGSAADLAVRSVAIALDLAPAETVVAGSLVDVWEVPLSTDRSSGAGTGAGAGAGTQTGAAPAEPRQLAAALAVSQVRRPEGAFVTGGSTIVYVLVPVDTLPAVLAAVAGTGSVELVPVPGSEG